MILIFIRIKNCKRASLPGIVCAVFERNYHMGPSMTQNLHGQAIVSPNLKIISSIIKESEYFDEEILKKASTKSYTPDEFNNAIISWNLVAQLFCMHLNISSLSYHHPEKYNLLPNVKIKPHITEISKTRLQRGKQPMTNISLPN